MVSFEYEKHFPHGAKIELFAPQREDQPFNQYFADWMEGKVLKETTRRNWESAFWKHLYPFFKDRVLSTITRADIAPVPEDPGGQGAAGQHYQRQAHEGAAHDAAPGLCGRDHPQEPGPGGASACPRASPMWILLPSRSGKPSSRASAGYAPLYVNYVICGFWTGWRPNEACALKWHRVDFQQGKILIREGRVLGQTGIPKSPGSLRDIDMLAPVREALTGPKGDQLAAGGSCLPGPEAAAGTTRNSSG